MILCQLNLDAFTLLKNTRSGNQKERIQVLWWLKTGQVQEHQELAHRLGRNKVVLLCKGWRKLRRLNFQHS